MAWDSLMHPYKKAGQHFHNLEQPDEILNLWSTILCLALHTASLIFLPLPMPTLLLPG